MPAHTRRIKFTKFGLAENPIGLHVVMPNGSLREVTGCYHREMPAAYVLQVRSFNREIVEEIAAAVVHVLDHSWDG